MVVNQDDSGPSPSGDDSTVCSGFTPPQSFTTETPDDKDPLQGDATTESLLVPSPGSTFIIRSVLCGRVITLLDGQIVLISPGSLGSYQWTCVETKGWLGFRNSVSGKFLGHDKSGLLRCSAQKHQEWEHFCCRMRPQGGHVLLMTHWDQLLHVGLRLEQGCEKLARIGDEVSDGIAWQFIKV